MRRYKLSLTLAVLAGCGGGDAASPPPPPASASIPASVSIRAGDGQSGVPGSKLPMRPTVVVKDAAGRPVSGVTVAFVVDTGGGRVDGGSAVTGSDGIATAGDWTLGPAEGPNRLKVTSGSLTPILFTASARFPTLSLADTTIGPAGGTYVYRKAGDPLDGLSIVVPAGAFPTPTRWTVATDLTVTVPLPAGFTQVGPTLVIGNGQGYADSVITLSMPMQLGADQAVAPFYFDPGSGTLEPIPLVGRNAASATLATRHFSRDLMAIPGSPVTAGSSLRPSLQVFGSVRVVWIKTPQSDLIGTFTSGFRAGVDDWEFENHGDYIAPDGDCEGMSITAMYYHYFFHRTSAGRGLYHQFDQSIPNQIDNIQGIRFAGSVQGEYNARWRPVLNQTDRLIQQGSSLGLTTADLTSSWILLTLKLNQLPVLLGLSRTNGGHAVVAYAASSTGSHIEVSIADPNTPGVARTMTFEAGHLTPLPMAVKTGVPPESYTQAYAVAVTAEIPLNEIGGRFAQFTKKQAGEGEYPAAYRTEVYDYLTDTWVTLGSTWTTTDSKLQLRHICPSCPIKVPGGATDEQSLILFDETGGHHLDPPWENSVGTTSYWVLMRAMSHIDPDHGIGLVDSQPFSVIYQPFTITPKLVDLVSGQDLGFTVNAGQLATAGSTYNWRVKDGSLPVLGTSSTTFTHNFTQIGENIVEVTLKGADGKSIARTDATVRVSGTVSLSQSPARAKPADPVTFTASILGTITPAAAAVLVYHWEVFNASGIVVDQRTTSVPSLSYTFPSAGSYSVEVGFSIDVVQTLSPKLPVEVRNWPGAWRLTTFERTAEELISPSAPVYMLTAFPVLMGFLDQVEATPSDGLIYLDDNAPPAEAAVYFQVAVPPGSGAQATYAVPGSMYTLLAWAAGSSHPFSSYTSSGDLNTGSIDGAAFVGWSFGSVATGMENWIHATKGPAGLHGTLRIGITTLGGWRTYAFTAVRVQ